MAKLGDICKFQSGGTPSKSNPLFFGGKIPWITTVALNGGIIDSTDAVEWITEKAIQESAAKLVPQNSIMVGTRVGIGKVAINSVPMSTSQDIVSLLGIDTQNWDKGFLCNCILAKNDFLLSQARGATIKGIKIETLSNLEVPNISIAEQRRITALLDKVTDLIAKRRAQLDKLDLLVKARFVEMFGDIWETVPLSYYIEGLCAGKSLAGEEKCQNKVLKTGAVSYDYFDSSQVKDLPLGYEPPKDHLVKTGDVIISRMNTAELVGAAAYVWKVPDDIYLPDRLWRAEIKSTAYPIFVWQLLIQPSTKESIRRIASGTSGSMKNISKHGLLSIQVKKVDRANQEPFIMFVTQIHKSKLTIQQSLDKLEALKKALMQQYFG